VIKNQIKLYQKPKN